MDTSTSCNSTSTSAPVKLELRLLYRCSLSAFRFDMTRFRVAFVWIRSIPTAHVTTVTCPYNELSGVYVCTFRCTRTRFQFKKPLPGEHSSEHFYCLRTHFQAFMNLVDIFSPIYRSPS